MANFPRGGALTERWRKPVSQVADWVPVDAALAWIDTESGGIPTTTTSLGERGLFQVHPDEVEFLRLTPEQFESLTTNVGFSIQTGIRQMKLFASQAKRDLASVGVEWHNRDFWKMTKLYHGAFGIPSRGLKAFARAKGRGPATWAEFREFMLAEAAAGRDLVPENKTFSAKLRALTAKVINNAEFTGETSGLPETNQAQVSVLVPLFRSFGLMI